MNLDDFQTWLADIRKRFPNTYTYASEHGLLETWPEVLADVELVDAMTVNFRIHSNAIKRPSHEEFPGFVRTESRSIAFDRRQREASNKFEPDLDSTSCGMCDDTGIVTDRDERGRKVGYACNCKLGDRVAAWHERDGHGGSKETHHIPRWPKGRPRPSADWQPKLPTEPTAPPGSPQHATQLKLLEAIRRLSPDPPASGGDLRENGEYLEF